MSIQRNIEYANWETLDRSDPFSMGYSTAWA
jgi:hypothetical protein